MPKDGSDSIGGRDLSSFREVMEGEKLWSLKLLFIVDCFLLWLGEGELIIACLTSQFQHTQQWIEQQHLITENEKKA